MRLLNTTTFELEAYGAIHQEYAILSHRWQGEEIDFQKLDNYAAELRTGRKQSTEQADKIRGACQVARQEGLKWLWMDTCCIDKTDAKEYAEAIKSMFRWYRDAKLCITYLYDVEKDDRIPNANPNIFKRIDDREWSEWFSRGWTLQELLAPREMKFYDMDWTYMGTKGELADALAYVTGIEARYHTGEKHIGEACIAVKMSWMSKRTTTRPEDMAYSMIGIFNVDMLVDYGEKGPRAFRRLQEALLMSSFMDESLFAWKMPDARAGERCNVLMKGWNPGEWGLLAGSPEWFRESGGLQVPDGRDSQDRSFKMTPKGLEAPIRRKLFESGEQAIEVATSIAWISMVAAPIGALGALALKSKVNNKAAQDYAFELNCFRYDANGTKAYVEIYLRPVLHQTVHLRPQKGGIKKPPYIECKRIRCEQLGISLKPIANYGMGIVYQPQPKN